MPTWDIALSDVKAKNYVKICCFDSQETTSIVEHDSKKWSRR